MQAPDTRFARLGEQQLAYQTFGDGPIDLLFVSGWFSHVDAIWEQPLAAQFFRRLGSFSRVTLFDRRGTGASDPLHRSATTSYEEWADDIRAVMDAVGIQRAALFSVADGARMAMLFAASFPGRTSHLVISTAAARFLRSEDHPDGVTAEQFERMLRAIGEQWGTGALIEMWAPSQTENAEFGRWWSRYQRASASPQMGEAALRATIEIDVRDVLPAIRVPTLVLQRRDNPLINVRQGRYIAEHIPEARYVEVPGADLFPWTIHADLILRETEAFVTGHTTDDEPDRVLATVLFTDIVESTRIAAELGDRRWGIVLDSHNDLVRRELGRHRGVEVGTTGDGFLATFDGPARAVRCACAIRDGVHPLGLEVRAGLHTGEVERRGDGVAGIAVHTGARVAAQASAGEVLVSRTVADLIAGSNISLADAGSYALKGVPGQWQLYSVMGT